MTKINPILMLTATILVAMTMLPSVNAGESYVHQCMDWRHRYFDCYGIGENDDGAICVVWWTKEGNPDDGDWDNGYEIVCFITCGPPLMANYDDEPTQAPRMGPGDPPCTDPIPPPI